SIRQYAPGSVKFAEAKPSSMAEISAGDQLRARGDKSADGTVAAEDIVFGTFQTRVGTIVAVNRETREVRIQDIASKAPLTIKLNADSQLKVMPAMHNPAGSNGNGHAAMDPNAPVDIAQILQRMPAGKIEQLEVGRAVVVTSTKNAQSDVLT